MMYWYMSVMAKTEFFSSGEGVKRGVNTFCTHCKIDTHSLFHQQ